MLTLVPMTQAEFDEYLGYAVAEYAQAHIQAGDCDPGEALPLAQADYAALLPQGLASANQHVMTLRNAAGDKVGMLWFELKASRDKRRSAYIFDFRIDAAHRRKGLGTQAMRALEQHVAPLGVTRINLNVMGWNDAARILYEKCGYRIAGIGMTKVLAG